jgi:hypothetical protein
MLDILVTGSYWQNWREVADFHPFDLNIRGLAGWCLLGLWAVTLVLMVAMWLVGLTWMVVIGPAAVPGADRWDAFTTLMMIMAIASSVTLASYSALRGLGWRHVVRYLGGGFIIVLLLMVPVR